MAKIFDYCIQCGEPIYAADDNAYGEDYVITPDGPVHLDDCLMDWGYRNRKEAKEEEPC